MKDEAVLFGSEQHLVGALTSPDDAESGVAAIFLTAGMLPSAGPFRLHRELAVAVAERGLRSLRFDLSGIGESLPAGIAGRSIDRAAGEAVQAMDWIQQQFGTERFVLFGLCSGADDSVQAARTDRRVVGLAIMDGCGYRTRGFWWRRVTRHYLKGLAEPTRLRRRLGRLFGASKAERSRLPMGTDIREFPKREVAVKQFQTLADRGVRMHFCYTGGVGDYYNDAGQFDEMFRDVDWRGTASTRFFASMDHVAMLREDRRLLVAHLAERIGAMAEPHRQPTRARPRDRGVTLIPASVTTVTDHRTNAL